MKVAVIGLGHIGLPLAVQYASRGHQVVGVDVDRRVVDELRAGRSPHQDEQAVIDGVPTLVADGALTATTWEDAAAVSDAEVIVVIVPVVVDAQRGIDFRPIDAATASVAERMRRGALVIYETTIPVGTTRDRFGPALAAGSGLALDVDFDLAFSPERVLVGRVLEDLRRYPKILGGTSDEAARRAAAFYAAALEPGTELRDVGSAEAAELTKLAETTYRDLNIAYANELARYATRRGLDVAEVIGAANTQPYSHIHQPGVGVGGHCIPVYPHFLFADDPELRLPRLAREINDGMAAWTIDVIEDRIGSLDGQSVLVLGIAYRPDVREDAFSSAFAVRDELRAAGARVYAHDPYFDHDHLRELGFEPADLEDPPTARVVVLQAAHRAYDAAVLAGLPGLELFVDGRNALDRGRFEQAGVTYVGIGR